MPGLFSKVFKKDSSSKTPQQSSTPEPPKPRWDDAWSRTEIEPEEVQELLRGCTAEIKSRALEMPFLLLPFRPASDPSAARTFIRNFFGSGLGDEPPMGGARLAEELSQAEPPVLCSVMKWCWSRLSGGVVTWDAYELFKMGENDSNNARDAFSTFIPISTANDARTKIITDFFDLMAAIAAHAKSNGFPGRKLSRYAGWWAFEHKSSDEGFDGGYKDWAAAADATSHLFFAYLRSLAPDPAKGALSLPRSLQQLLEQSEYPPVRQTALQSEITKVVMIVDQVSPTPFALLRRAKNFEYRSDDQLLRAFAEQEDPIKALTDECKRILQGIASSNDSSNTKLSTSLKDASWSRFEDIGFGANEDENVKTGIMNESALTKKRSQRFEGLQSLPASTIDVGRPTTPSWADFTAVGFAEQSGTNTSSFLPPDKQLPPLSIRGSSANSDRIGVESDTSVGAGELASIKAIAVDDVFWWVWITSLSGEETIARKSTFGRCAFIETKLNPGVWLLFEEVVKGAKAEPANPGYVAEKKSRFGFRKMSMKKVLKSTPTKNAGTPTMSRNGTPSPSVRKTIAPDQHARIQAAAAALTEKKSTSITEASSPERRGRLDPDAQSKTASVLTLQPVIMSEAAPAMKWANSYDKNEIRAQYLGNRFAGKGSAVDLPTAENKSIAPSEASRDPKAEAASKHGSAALAPPEPPKKDSAPDVAMAQTRKPVPAAATEAPKTPQQNVSAPRSAGDVVTPVRTSSRDKTDGFKAGMEYGKQAPGGGLDQAASPVQTSPTASSKLSKKLPGRFGSVFGRKKNDEETKTSGKQASTREVAAASAVGGGSAVAAARAALEAKSQQSSASNARQQVTAIRTSVNEDAAAKPESEENTEQVKTPQEAAAAAAIQTPIAEPTAAPHNIYPEKAYEPSYTTDSHVDEAENHAAEREFSKFDQGPMGDAPALDPAYAQKDSPVSALTEEPAQQPSETVNTGNGVHAETETVGEQHQEPEAPSTELIAEAVEEAPGTRARALSNERWAQIRKNAAERVAARQSEETSHQTKDTEDDGETSGEETIESRVARIKARVAELTGNMEVPSAGQDEQ